MTLSRVRTGMTLVGLLTALAMAGTAFAHSPVVQITNIAGTAIAASDTTATITVAVPSTVDVVVQVTHEDPGNINGVQSLVLNVNGTAVDTIADPKPADDATSCSISSNTATCTLQWPISATGSYDLQAVASHGSFDGSDSVLTTVQELVVNVSFPAAPAVANMQLDADPALKAQCMAAFGTKDWRGRTISAVADWHVVDGENRKLAYQDAGDYAGWVDAVRTQLIDVIC